MPKEANVFIADDDPASLENLVFFIEEGKHRVVATAGTLTEALNLISQFDKLGVQVAVLDANLSPMETRGFDGIAMVKKIREKAPQVKIIGCSKKTFPVAVDVDLGRSNAATQIAKVIEELQ